MERCQHAKEESEAGLRDLDLERQDEFCRPELLRKNAPHTQLVMHIAQDRAGGKPEAIKHLESQITAPQGFLYT